MYKPVLAAFAVAVTLSSCAGRAPAPVPVAQMQDRYANRTAIMARFRPTTNGSASLARSRAGR